MGRVEEYILFEYHGEREQEFSVGPMVQWLAPWTLNPIIRVQISVGPLFLTCPIQSCEIYQMGSFPGLALVTLAQGAQLINFHPLVNAGGMVEVPAVEHLDGLLIHELAAADRAQLLLLPVLVRPVLGQLDFLDHPPGQPVRVGVRRDCREHVLDFVEQGLLQLLQGQQGRALVLFYERIAVVGQSAALAQQLGTQQVESLFDILYIDFTAWSLLAIGVRTLITRDLLFFLHFHFLLFWVLLGAKFARTLALVLPHVGEGVHIAAAVALDLAIGALAHMVLHLAELQLLLTEDASAPDGLQLGLRVGEDPALAQLYCTAHVDVQGQPR